MVAKFVEPAVALKSVKSGDQVYVGSNCANPLTLTTALVSRANELRDVLIFHLLITGTLPYMDPGLSGSFRHAGYFLSGNSRQAANESRADYIPIFLSDIPRLLSTETGRPDVALVAVAPPDEHGYCSLGVSVDIGMAACKNAKSVIAQVMPDMPRTLGDSCLHISEIDFLCEADHKLFEHKSEPPDATSLLIAGHIRELIYDGCCLQTGFGKLPSAVLDSLTDLNDLSIHTEMFSDSIVDLVERGNINCKRKTVYHDKAVCTFALGTRKLFDAIDDNPLYEFRPTEQVNDPFIIAQNDNMVSINSAIEIDLTGQVVADSIGSMFYSGIGGQVDFIRGASRSKNGKPIIALPSTARAGTKSRITAKLSPGAGVVTSRGDVHWVITEHGKVNLHGLSVRERARELIQIAHPDFRDQLREEAKELNLISR